MFSLHPLAPGGPEHLRPESYAGERGRVRTRVPMATIFCSGWPRQEAGKSFREAGDLSYSPKPSPGTWRHDVC